MRGGRMGWGTLGAVVAAIGSISSLAVAEELPNPRALGPYPVGVTTMVVVDHSRQDPATNGPRTLVTEVWYPATDETRDLPTNLLTDFLMRGQTKILVAAFQAGFRVKIAEVNKTFSNVAVRDARMRDGTFPLIVFSHGNGGIRFQSTFWCDHMASHGYVVMSCDHTGNAAATVVDGRMILHDSKQREQHAVDRPADVSFLIDQMTRFAGGADSRFAGRINLDQIAVAGHSFGGFTANAVMNTDERVKAIIPMTPVFRERTRDGVPLLLILGTEDATIGAEGNSRARTYFDDYVGPKYLVEITDAGHFSFSDMAQYRPEYGDGIGKGKRITKADEPITYLGPAETFEITNAYSVAFLGVHLLGNEGYRPFLSANQYPSLIIYREGDSDQTSEKRAGTTDS